MSEIDMRFKVRRKTSAGAGVGTDILPGEIIHNVSEGLFYIGLGPAKADGTATSSMPFANASLVNEGATKSFVNDAIDEATPKLGNALSLLDDGVTIKLSESAELEGAPTVAAAPDDDETTKIANTGWVQRELREQFAKLMGAGDEATTLTLQKLFEDIASGTEGRDLLSTAIAKNMTKASNLSELPDKGVARANLGLKSMAEQSSDNVDLTGGIIRKGMTFEEGFVIDGGEY